MGPIALALTLGLLQTPQASPPVATRLLFEMSPPVDLWFFVRAQAETEEMVAGFDPAIEAVRALSNELGSFLAWGAIEGALKDCRVLAQVGEAFHALPETFEARSGKKVALRAGAEKIFAGLREAEKPFFEQVWPAHQQAITGALGMIQPAFEEKLPACLAYHIEKLGMKDPGLQVPVYLLGAAPSPGAVTHRDPQGRGVCFIAVTGVERTQLFETILHEATHALDIATEGASVLEDLRARLLAAGVQPRERAFRDLPHTLMFVQAAESIRRTVDPAHKDYGDVSGYYGRIGKPAEIVRGFWRDFLDGKIAREEALEGIASAGRDE